MYEVELYVNIFSLVFFLLVWISIMVITYMYLFHKFENYLLNDVIRNKFIIFIMDRLYKKYMSQNSYMSEINDLGDKLNTSDINAVQR